MNCNKMWRFNGQTGSLVPYDGSEQYGGSPYETSTTPLAISQQAGNVPAAPVTGQTAGKKRMDWGQFAQMAGMGALAGFGGNKGVAMAPIMALLMQLPQFKKLASGRTPGFNPNAKVIDDGKYGG